MHSTLVIKDEILKAHPWLAQALFDAFRESKERYLARLRRGEGTSKKDQQYTALMKVVGDDPLPYGLNVNLRSIETLIRYAYQQGLAPRMPGIDELFINVNP